jgi:hypothetical protein
MTTLRNLPIVYRALFTSFLVVIGIGYLTALSLLYFVDIEPHKALGQGVVEGISESYHGAPRGMRLEAALIGPMADKLSTEDRTRIFQWLDRGARAEDYPTVATVFATNCAGCHSPQSGLSIPPLTSYEDVAKVVRQDPGPSISQLARVSHIHLFGISIIFLLTGAIFSLSGTQAWLRVGLVVLPYLTILMDIGSWWATRYLSPVFAYVVIAGGGLMGLAMASQIFISLWDMWIDLLKRPFGSAAVRSASPQA